ncbi:MAG: hypothetical protein VKP62_05045 [Candidatus Sericytochromatia bacterium]|nr:hypothetical protein [Candidatus Sericytochromatia bacterium]
MTMSQMGGDSQNTMPVAINAGLTARQIASLTPADPNAAKFSMDAFKRTLGNPGGLLDGSVKNLPLSEALAQQSVVTRFAAKIPFVRRFLGPDFILNEAIGRLGKDALGGLSKPQVTQIALEGGDVAGKLAKAGLSREVAEEIGKKSAERLSALGGQAAGAVGRQMVNQLDEIAKEAVGMTMKKGFQGASQEAVKKALASPDAYEALKALGFYAKDAKVLVTKAAGRSAEVATRAATGEAARVAGQTAASEAAEGGIKGFFGKLLSGAKGNFVVAGAFSLASNAIQLAQGKMSVPQFIGLTALDTAAYGAIGWGSAAAGAAIGTALFPGVGSLAGFVIGLGIGFVGGALYEKVLRDPVKGLLGGGNPQPAYDPSRSSDTARSASEPNRGPQTPATPRGNAGLVQPSGSDLTYDEALRQIEQFKTSQ